MRNALTGDHALLLPLLAMLGEEVCKCPGISCSVARLHKRSELSLAATPLTSERNLKSSGICFRMQRFLHSTKAPYIHAAEGGAAK